MELRSITRNKRGMSLGDLYPVILTIALVAILLAVVMYVLGELGNNMPLEAATVTNETLTSPWAAINQTVDDASNCNFQSMASVVVTNATTGVVLTSGNYTAYSDGNIINASAQTGYSSGAWNTSYTYQWGGEACTATENVTEDFTDFVPWIGVILLIIAAAIVLGIVIRSFAGGSRV